MEKIHENGYLVFRNSIKFDPDTLQYCKNLSKQRKRSVIFNKKGYNDGKRRQYHISLKNKKLNDIRDRICLFLKDVTDFDASQMVILHSLPGCQEQVAHTDYVITEELIKTKNEDMPFVTITALQNDTKIKVWPKSHLIWKKYNKVIIPIEEKLNQGDIVIFRADLVHAGSSYSEENMRFHIFLDSKKISRTLHRNFIISKDGDRKTKELLSIQ